MIEFTILVPLVRDSSRTAHSASTWHGWHHKLTRLAGGYSVGHSLVKGVWLDSHGKQIEDNCREYRIAVEPNRQDDVWELCRVFCKEFDQQCLYCKISSVSAHLVYPSAAAKIAANA